MTKIHKTSLLSNAAGLGLLLCLAACPDMGSGPGPSTSPDLADAPDLNFTPDLAPDLLDILASAYTAKSLACYSLPDPVPPEVYEVYKPLYRRILMSVVNGVGSGFTLDKTLACARTLEALPCHEFFYSPAPLMYCLVTGTLPPGSVCLDHGQCQSGHCRPSGTCGVCITPAQAGEPCSAITPCASGLHCVANQCSTGVEAGGMCDGNHPCRLGLFCVAGKCMAPGRAGEGCFVFTTPPCELGLTCRNKVCVPLLPANSACDLAIAAPQCSLLHRCDRGTQRCTPVKVVASGERCDEAVCKDGICNDFGRCEPFIEDGQRCDFRSHCRLPATCMMNVCTQPMSCP